MHVGNPMNIVFDTSVLIDYLRSVQKKKLNSSIFYPEYQGFIPIEVVAELYSSKNTHSGNEEEKIKSFLSRLTIYTPTIDFMKSVGLIRANYQLSVVDACVAQLALDNDAPLATLNKKAFSRIPYLLWRFAG